MHLVLDQLRASTLLTQVMLIIMLIIMVIIMVIEDRCFFVSNDHSNYKVMISIVIVI